MELYSALPRLKSLRLEFNKFFAEKLLVQRSRVDAISRLSDDIASLRESLTGQIDETIATLFQSDVTYEALESHIRSNLASPATLPSIQENLSQPPSSSPPSRGLRTFHTERSLRSHIQTSSLSPSVATPTSLSCG